MNETNRCNQCGGPLPDDGLLGGSCPRCMLELGYETNSESAKDASVGILPKSIGRYRILRVIGEGGMGIVYEAEQDRPRRTVALKIIKRGMSSPELLRRFEQESQALGRLQHPGIAQIYEAGTVDTGFGPQPYFAMELIRGHPPREFAELHHLDTRQRIELMVGICEAVHHAHQRSLIHRDLKPANILIDEGGQPKILDFGVARVTDSDTRSTIETDIGQLIGTLAYMSPEQALADPMELDTRTDVYSLGIILYELLTGRLPYAVSKKVHEAIQSIRDDDPARISAVNRSYRGDIETIVGKALEKDKNRRYQSAFGLAIDLRRYLKDEPISARAPSRTYQLRKFTRRHKHLVAGVAAVFVVLIAGIYISALLAVQFNRAALVAEDARARAHKAELAASLASAKANDEAVVASRAKQDALIERDHALTAQRTAQAALDRAIAADNRSLQEQDRATQAAQIAASALTRVDTAESQAEGSRNRAIVEQQRAASYAESTKILSEIIRDNLFARTDSGRSLPTATGPRPSDLSPKEFLDAVSADITGRFETRPIAEANLREVLATAYLNLRLFAWGEVQLKRALELRIRAEGETNSHTLKTLEDLAVLRIASNRIQGPNSNNLSNSVQRDSDNEAILKNIVDTLSRTLDEENPTTLASMDFLAAWFYTRGRFPEEEAVRIRILAGRSRTLGETDLVTVAGMTALVICYEQQDKSEKATELLKRLEAAIGRNPRAVTSMIPLIAYYEIQGKSQRAIQISEKVNVVFRSLGDEDPATRAGLRSLWTIYFNFKRFSEAEEVAIRLSAFHGDSNLNNLQDMIKLIAAYEKQGKFDQAGKLSKLFETSLQTIVGADPEYKELLRAFTATANVQGVYNIVLPPTGEEKLSDVRNLLLLGATYSRLGIYPEAERLLTRGMDVSIRLQPQRIPYSGVDIAREFVALYSSWGNPEKETAWRKELQAMQTPR